MRDVKRIKLILLLTSFAFSLFAIGTFLMIKIEQADWEKSSDFMVSVSRQRTATYKVVNALLTIPYGVMSPEQKTELKTYIRNSQTSLRRFYNETKGNGNPFLSSTLRVVESVYIHASQTLENEQFQDKGIKRLLFLHKNALDQLDQLLAVELQKTGLLREEHQRRHQLLLFSSIAALVLFLVFIYLPFTRKYEQSQLLLEKQTEELILKNKALIQTNRDLDRFAYVTSHDLKSPLRAINNLAEWIDEDAESKLSVEGKRYFEILKNRVRRMERLINGILEYSRISRTEDPEEPVSISIIVEQTINSLNKSFHFDIDIDPQLPVVSSHSGTIRRIFEHLIHNAIQFNTTKSPKIWVYSEPTPDGISVFVKDNGPGIEGRFHGKVFEIFQTLNNKDEMETTGIGLAIVKKAMEQLGGIVKLHNPAEGGVMVELGFPSAKLITKKAEL